MTDFQAWEKDVTAIKVLVVAPTRRELGGLAPGQRRGLLVAVTGLGKDATRSALGRLLAHHRPSAVVSLGFAAGVSPQAHSGELVLCDRAMTMDGPSVPAIASDAQLLEQAQDMARQGGLTCLLGGLATFPAPLLTAGAKAQAGQDTGATAADMEGYWVALESRQAGVPWLLVRSVLDAVHADLPDMVGAIVADQGRHELGHTARYLLGKPWGAGRVLSLALDARRAARALDAAARHLVVPLAARLDEVPTP